MNKFLKVFFILGVLAAAGCDPKDGVKELENARAAMETRDYTKATKLISRSLEYAPGNVDALVLMAQAKLALGELADADQAIAKAMESNGDDLDVRYLAAQISWHLKRYDESLRLYRAIADDSSLPPADRSRGWTGLGIVQMSMGEAHLARVSFLLAIRLDRRNASAWYHLGIVYRDSPFGYSEAALEQFNIYVRLEPEASPRVQKTQRTLIPGLKEMIARAAMDRPGVSKRDSAACAAAIAAAEAAWKKNSFKTARKKYEEALVADPLSYVAALGLAKAIQKTDNTKVGQQKTFEAYRTACVLRPSAISTFLTAGDYAVRLGLNSQAVEIYSRAVAANPASFVALDGLIRSLRKTGKPKIAAAYQQYRDLLTSSRKK